MNFTVIRELNNEGARLMNENNDKEALQHLVSAFSQISAALRIAGSAVRTCPDMKKVAFLHSDTFPLTEMGDNTCFVFNRAVVLSSETHCELWPGLFQDGNTIRSYAAVVLLNLALCYHRSGLGGCKDSIFTAMKMYEMVVSVLAQSNANEGTELLVMIAAINNLAQLKFVQGDIIAAAKGFQFLGTLLDSAGRNLQQTRCQEEVYNGFFLNCLLVVPSETAAAA